MTLDTLPPKCLGALLPQVSTAQTLDFNAPILLHSSTLTTRLCGVISFGYSGELNRYVELSLYRLGKPFAPV